MSFIVFRPARDLPPGVMPDNMNGEWYDISDPIIARAFQRTLADLAHPTGRYETLPNGEQAQVWEMSLNDLRRAHGLVGRNNSTLVDWWPALLVTVAIFAFIAWVWWWALP